MPPLNDLLGWLASSLVFAAFCAREMLPLRLFAIASNVAFIGYGYSGRLWPIVFLHTAMLPMNVVRLRQVFPASRPKAVVRRWLLKRRTSIVRRNAAAR